ncbi:MAG TPA: hypothetical protein VG936_05175 [Lacunisphaera sp.]|nr:hypothetical protein [Lacunisphaera sp.]
MTPAHPPACPHDSEPTAGTDAPARSVTEELEPSSRRLHYLALAYFLATFGDTDSRDGGDASAPAEPGTEPAR